MELNKIGLKKIASFCLFLPMFAMLMKLQVHEGPWGQY